MLVGREAGDPPGAQVFEPRTWCDLASHDGDHVGGTVSESAVILGLHRICEPSDAVCARPTRVSFRAIGEGVTRIIDPRGCGASSAGGGLMLLTHNIVGDPCVPDYTAGRGCPPSPAYR